MAVRIMTSIVGLPILIGLVLLGGIWLKIGVIVLSLVGMYEFYKAVDKKILPVHGVGFVLAVLYIVSLGVFKDNIFRLLLIAFIPLILIVQVIMNEKININNAASTLFGFFYIAFMFSNVFLIRNSYLGNWTIWLVFICAFCCDTGAYFTGICFGKHKLAPVLSPKKTIEGAVGGVVSAGLCAALYGFVIKKFADVPNNINIILICFVIGIIGAVFAEIGDLAASSIKRYTGIKDFGKIIPGHGGVLDRFDSVIFTSAVVYLLLLHFIKLQNF